MLFDTHAHLDDKRFDEDRDKVIKGLSEKGVGLVVNPGANIDTSRKALEIAQDYSPIYAGVGVHPHDAKTLEDGYINKLRDMATHEKVVAIGEIGLDYHYDFSPRDIQRERFVEQIHLASELGLPIIIHNRESHGDMLDILRAHRNIISCGVMHSYSGSWEMAKIVMDLGLYISLAGPVTFKNAKIPVEIGRKVPLDRLLIETDSPYLTPVPYRGKRNDPGHVGLVAERIAEIRGISIDKVAKATMKNGTKLFKIAKD